MATTSKVLGTVTSVVGEVKATASDGTTRILQIGDKVFSDEVISTSPTGDVKIALEGGGHTLECGNDSNLALHEGLLGIGTAIATQDSSPVVPPSVAAQQEMAAPGAKPPAGPADVAALQAAIASGADPSQVAEATAAGGAPGAGGAEGGGSHSPVIIEQGSPTQNVTSGFVTTGGSIQFPTPEINELPPVEGQPVVSVSVSVQVDVENPENPGSGGSGGVVVSGNAASLIEGTNGAEGKLVNFIISLDQPFDSDVQVTYTIMPVTASTPSDFFDGPLTQTVTILAGDTQIVVPVTIVQDHLVEADETFNIVLTNAVNATINPAANTAVVTIVDDDALPVANPDTNWVQEDVMAEGQDAPTVSGNVLENQSHAGDPSAVLTFADAADTDDEPLTVTTTGTFNGTYGTLVLNSDGSYTYTLNNGNAAVQALDDGETLTDTFNYSVTDGFNTPSSSTVAITIFGSNDGPEITVQIGQGPFATSAEGTVLEEALSTIGSNPDSDGEFVTGSFKVSDPNGIDDIESVTINGDQTVLIGDLVGATFQGESGVLTVTSYANGTASFKYELTEAVTDGEGTETDVFTLTTSDGDSDSAPATITINIVDDVPSVDTTGEVGSLSVDETLLTTDTDSADFSSAFSSVSGADGASVSYALGIAGANGLDSGLNDSATGQNILLVLNGNVVEGHVGSTGGALAFTLTLSGSTVTLDQTCAVMHGSADAGTDANEPVSLDSIANLVTLTATITDADGDTDTATIDLGKQVSFLDDGPNISVSAGDTTVVEGGTISNGAWTSDAGADGGVVKVTFDGTDYNLGQAIDTGKGTLTVNANGTWTFAAANNLDQDVAQAVSFDLKITDADGDFASDSHTISISDGEGPAVSDPVTLVVDEGALPDGTNPSSPDDVDTATLTFTSGSDAIDSITFGSTAGITVSGLDETQSITWTASIDGRTLTGSVGGTDVIRVDLSGATTVPAGGNTGDVTATATLLDNLLHQNSPDVDSLTISGIQVVGADPDGDTATFTFTGVTVNDDAATVVAPSGTIENDTGESLGGLIDYDMNADGLGTVTLNAPTVTSGGEPLTLTSHGDTIVYQIADTDSDGLQELYAFADTDGNGLDAGDTPVFTLAPSAAGAADGSYTLTLNDVVDLPVPTVALSFTGISASGPVEEINVGGQLLISTVFPADDDVNANQGFVGIDNNIMNGPKGAGDGESIRYEFGTVTATATPGDFNIVHEDVNDLQLDIFNTGSGSDTFQWTAYKDGVQVGQDSVTFSGDGLTSPIHVDGGFDSVVLKVTDGDFKVGGVTFTEIGAPQDVNLNVVFGGADADGDAIGGSFDVTITSGNGTAESHIVQTLLNNNNETH